MSLNSLSGLPLVSALFTNAHSETDNEIVNSCLCLAKDDSAQPALCPYISRQLYNI